MDPQPWLKVNERQKEVGVIFTSMVMAGWLSLYMGILVFRLMREWGSSSSRSACTKLTMKSAIPDRERGGRTFTRIRIGI
jgi:hypothetical protein